MDRPVLTKTTSAADFLAFYWLKQELVAFCQAYELSTAGSKQELTARIAAFLETGKTTPVSPRRQRVSAEAAMPTVFTRQTVIGPQWRCTEALRGFFVQELGPRFHFNQVIRSFFKDGTGKTLGDAITAWQAARQQSAALEIEPQFEYNRHVRDYFRANPGKTLQDAIAAWNELKAQRKPTETREL